MSLPKLLKRCARMTMRGVKYYHSFHLHFCYFNRIIRAVGTGGLGWGEEPPNNFSDFMI